MDQEEEELNKEDTVKVSSREKSQRAISSIVISAMMLALAIVLKEIAEAIPFLNFPNGGNVSLVMVPLALCGLYCGPVWGTGISLAFSVYDFFRDSMQSFSPNVAAIWVTLILDYLIGFGVMGICSAFRKPFFEKKVWAPLVAMVAVSLLRFLSSFFSGVIIWNNIWDYEGPIQADWSAAGVAYSISYNAGYMLPSCAMSVVVLLFLLKPMYIVMGYPVVRPLYPKNVQFKESSVLPDMQKLVPFYLGACYALGIISSIPQLYIYWVGYISMVMAAALAIFEVYQLVQAHKKNESIFLPVLYLSLALVAIFVSILGICSAYTYGKDLYVARYAKED